MRFDRNVSNLPQLKGPAAWNSILPTQPEPVVLENPVNADIVIVGAGFAGLSAAHRLVQIDSALKIVVLEAGRIAESSAGRNSGFMIDLPHELNSEDYAGEGDESAKIKLNRHAISFAAGAVEEYQIDRNFFDRAGKINGAATERTDSNNRSYANHLENLGESFELMDQKQMADTTGSGHYISGLYTPGTVVLQPAGYIRGLAEGLRNRNVGIYENSPVSRITKEDNKWKIHCGNGQVNSEKVILTVNGHLESFGVERGHLMQIFLYATMTPDLDNESLKKLGGESRWGVTPSDPMGTTMRKIDKAQGGNRIITRTCATMRQNMRTTERDLQRATNVMRKKFDQRFPQLKGLQMEYQWSGHLCLSLNSVSVVREVENGLFAGCVQNGLGTCRGTLSGIGAAEISCGIKSDVTDFFTSEQPPKKLPPQPFCHIGANSLLRWKEWRARRE